MGVIMAPVVLHKVAKGNSDPCKVDIATVEAGNVYARARNYWKFACRGACLELSDWPRAPLATADSHYLFEIREATDDFFDAVL